MEKTFKTALAAVLAHEGGYVNHPKDPGGATNRGVTQGVYDNYRRRLGLELRSVRRITEEEVATIYRQQYWNKVRGNDLPSGVDYAVFDFAVNSGVFRAVRYLQGAVGVVADGEIGPKTLGAVAAQPAGETIDDLCDRRLAFLRRLPTFEVFGLGWSRRVAGVRKLAKELI